MSGSLSMSGSRANGSRTFLTGTNGLDVPGSGGSTEVVRSVNDLLERNAELVTALQRERNRAADSLRKIDSLERELEAERTQRQKLEIDSADGVKELLAARQEVMERRTEVAATEHQAGEQQRLQGQLLELLEREVAEGDAVVRRMRDALLASDAEIAALNEQVVDEDRRRVAAEEELRKFQQAAGETHRRLNSLLKYREEQESKVRKQMQDFLRCMMDGHVEVRQCAESGDCGVFFGEEASALILSAHKISPLQGRFHPVSLPRHSYLQQLAAGLARSGQGAVALRDSHAGPEGSPPARRERAGATTYNELRLERDALDRRLKASNRQARPGLGSQRAPARFTAELRGAGAREPQRVRAARVARADAILGVSGEVAHCGIGKGQGGGPHARGGEGRASGLGKPSCPTDPPPALLRVADRAVRRARCSSWPTETKSGR